MRFALLAAALTLVLAAPARAEVTAATPSAFMIEAEATVAANPMQAWRALTHIENWWSAEHTYSGDARRLSLEPRAGGCWCERWGHGQSVEHARVVMVTDAENTRTLRVVGGFGPLQEMGVSGVLTFAISPTENGAKIAMRYRVSGDSGLGLDQIAPFVDQVLMQQFARLVSYADGGSPQ